MGRPLGHLSSQLDGRTLLHFGLRMAMRRLKWGWDEGAGRDVGTVHAYVGVIHLLWMGTLCAWLGILAVKPGLWAVSMCMAREGSTEWGRCRVRVIYGCSSMRAVSSSLHISRLCISWG